MIKEIVKGMVLVVCCAVAKDLYTWTKNKVVDNNRR